MLLGLIALLVLLALLYPQRASEGFTSKEVNGQYSDNYIIAESNPVTPITPIYAMNSRVKETYRDPELYQYFIVKSIESNIDMIYNIPFADCLILAESGWNPNAKNPASTAHGLGQFLTSTWNNTDKALESNLNRNNPYDQIDAFTYLLSTDGYKHWIVYPSCTYLLPIEKRIASLK